MSPILFFSFFACGENSTETEVKTEATPSKVETSMPKAQEDVAPTEKAVEPPVASSLSFTETPKQYSGQWIVILQSSKELDTLPPKWDAIQKRNDLQPARLKSGLYKNLMPCWSIVVASGFSDKNAASALSTELKEAGIDNYVKNAGKFVGEDPRIEKLCSTAQEKIDASPYRLGISANGHIQMRVDVSDILLERMVKAHYKDLTAFDDSVWHTTLPVHNIDGFQQGDAFTAINIKGTGPAKNCTIQKFSMMVLGIPHFSMQELNKPACGEPEIFAELDCVDSTLEKPYLLIAAAQPLPEIVRVGTASPTPAFARDTHLEKIYQDALKEAQRQQEELKIKTSSSELLALDGSYSGSLLSVQYLTKEGNNYCGGDDLNISHSGVFQGTKQISPFLNTTDQSILAIINPFSEDPLFIREEWPISWRIVDKKEEYHYAINKDFCDCGC